LEVTTISEPFQLDTLGVFATASYEARQEAGVADLPLPERRLLARIRRQMVAPGVEFDGKDGRGVAFKDSLALGSADIVNRYSTSYRADRQPLRFMMECNHREVFDHC